MTGESRPRAVFCNRAPRSAIRRRAGDPEPLVLDYRDDSRVRLRLPDFVRSVGTIPPRVLDLIELAGYLFAADRLAPRGQPDALLYDSWSRRFHVAMKVRDAEFWSDEATEIVDAMLPGDREEQFIEEIFKLVNRFGKQTVAALEAFFRSADVKKRPVAGSLLDIIWQQEYLKTEPERFAQKLGEKLRRAVPAMFATNPPANENDLNDKLQGLLQAEGEEYRREFPATQFGLARVIPDHEFQKYNVLIEAKYIRGNTTLSKVTDQVAADIVKYPASAYIVFAIYDPHRAIRDDVQFARDIEARRKCMVVALR